MTLMSDMLGNDDNEEVVVLDDASQEGAEDRGDVVAGDEPLDPELLKAVAGEAEPPKEESEKSSFVPHARFNEVNEAKKAAERRAAELEAELERLSKASASRQEPAAEPATSGGFDFDAKEAEAADALFNGDVDKYRKIQAEIRSQTEAQATQRALEQFEQRSAARTAQSLLEASAERIASAHPFLNSESDAANPEAIKEVVEWRDFFIARGDKPHTALEKAAAKVAPLYARGADPDDDQPPTVDPRKAAAVARAAAAAAAQPPIGGGIGERASAARLDVEKMTDDQFNRLSDDEKRRLRGD